MPPSETELLNRIVKKQGQLMATLEQQALIIQDTMKLLEDYCNAQKKFLEDTLRGSSSDDTSKN